MKSLVLLFQYAQFFAHLDEGGNATVEVFAVVAGRNLHADAGLILRHDGVVETGHIDALVLETSRVVLREFDIKPTQSAICAVMLYDAKLSQDYAARLQDEGIYVTGFYYPVVPKDQARIRVQISAGHNREHLDRCIAAFIKVGKELGVLK